MSILKLKPSCKDYIWGGRRLAEEYGKEYDGDVLAESWELSCHPDGPSTIENGIYRGRTLQEYIEGEGKAVLGENCRRFREFPILIKFIDARENLSIQVHPSNHYALKNEGQYGKTEMWYVVDAREGAYLYYGFQKEISREEFEKRITEDSLLEVLNAVPVHKGDVLFIESGTIHAIGKDILIAEIQQNSNVTYRVYDYGRVGKDGRKRDLHIEKALDVTNRVPIVKSADSYPHVADCDYFTVDKLNLDGKVFKTMSGTVGKDSFVSILMLSGSGTVANGGEELEYQKGDSLFLPAGSGEYEIKGSCDALITTIHEKAGAVRIGIDIGGTNVKLGLVDDCHKILASEILPTEAEQTPEEITDRITKKVLQLLEKENIQLEDCTGVGIGVAGTVDKKRGNVRYSNNLGWEDVELAKLVEKNLPLPVHIANDADCAALGEACAGGGRGFQDLVMITLGTGVGGGVVLDGKIYDGRRTGGSEIGHMVIVEDGEPCTCGRRGCLEAYVSVSALKRSVRKKCGRDLEPEVVFDLAKEDAQMREVVEAYIKKLATGIINIVNIFRPEVILLCGGIAEQGEWVLEPLREQVQKQCFGGSHGEIPEIRAAKLGNVAGIIGAAGLAWRDDAD